MIRLEDDSSQRWYNYEDSFEEHEDDGNDSDEGIELDEDWSVLLIDEVFY